MTASEPATSARRARYGVSHVLGDVEYLDARFARHRFAPHSHPVFAIGAVRVGACRIWHTGVSHTAHAGDLVLINPGEPHSADQLGSGEWDYCAVYVSSESLRRWLPAPMAGARLRGVVGRSPALAGELAGICEALGDDPERAGAEDAFARFIRTLFGAFGDARPDAEVARGASGPIAVRAHLDANFASPIRLEELADIAGTSTFTLIRTFSRAFGMPPYRYLSHVRVARAQGMLRQGRPISETAFSTGFSDQAHFTKFFRRIVGVPPGVWMRGVGRTPAPVLPAEPGRPAFYFSGH